MPCYELLAELLPGVRPMLDQVILDDDDIDDEVDGDGAICNFCILVLFHLSTSGRFSVRTTLPPGRSLQRRRKEKRKNKFGTAHCYYHKTKDRYLDDG